MFAPVHELGLFTFTSATSSFNVYVFFSRVASTLLIPVFDGCLFSLSFYIPLSPQQLRYNWKDQVIAYATDAIFISIFVFALIFDSHQTEATYRLDFIWKLQATGKTRK